MPHLWDQLCKKQGLCVTLETHFLVLRLRGCERINWEASPVRAHSEAWDGQKHQSLSEEMAPSCSSRSHPGAAGAAQLELVLAVVPVIGPWPGSWWERGHPSPGEKGAGIHHREKPGRHEGKGCSGAHQVGTKQSCGDSRSARCRLPISKHFLTHVWTALCHKLEGSILKEALIKS